MSVRLRTKWFWVRVQLQSLNSTNACFQNFLDSTSKILDKHAPLKKLGKYKLQFKTKPWITTALQKSISMKNKLFREDLTQKTEVHIKYKSYRNVLSTLMKNSKRNYLTKFFDNNLKNLKNTSKGIKSIISMKSSSNFPILLTYQNENIDKTERIANMLNNYFSTNGEKDQSKKKTFT